MVLLCNLWGIILLSMFNNLCVFCCLICGLVVKNVMVMSVVVIIVNVFNISLFFVRVFFICVSFFVEFCECYDYRYEVWCNNLLEE